MKGKKTQAEKVEKLLFTMSDASRMLGLSRPSLYRLMELGVLRSTQFDLTADKKTKRARHFFTREALEAVANGQPSQAA